MFPKIGVPPNRPILIGFSFINHPFWGPTPIFGNTHIAMEIDSIWELRICFGRIPDGNFFKSFETFSLKVKETPRSSKSGGSSLIYIYIFSKEHSERMTSPSVWRWQTNLCGCWTMRYLMYVVWIRVALPRMQRMQSWQQGSNSMFTSPVLERSEVEKKWPSRKQYVQWTHWTSLLVFIVQKIFYIFRVLHTYTYTQTYKHTYIHTCIIMHTYKLYIQLNIFIQI